MLTLDSSATGGAKSKQTIPSQLSVQHGLRLALEEMHGVVGGAFPVDILYTGEPIADGAKRPGTVAEAVLRTPTEYVVWVASSPD